MKIKLVNSFSARYVGFWFGVQWYAEDGCTYVGLGPISLRFGVPAKVLPEAWYALRFGTVARVSPEAWFAVGEYRLPANIYTMTMAEYAAMVLVRDGEGA